MPFKSYAQMTYLKQNSPKVYNEWMRKYGPYKGKRKRVRKNKYTEVLRNA